MLLNDNILKTTTYRVFGTPNRCHHL